MRNNGPVTNIERSLGEHERVISKTDTKGRITYVNRTFEDISDFTREEVIGKAHNIVRHPDMPAEAFEDLWHTIKAGRSWRGLVKNRCKNGDYYWVEANVNPIIEKNGEITGYESVRIPPTREQVEWAENTYRLVREGRANHLRIKQGRVIHRGLRGLIGRLRMTSLKSHLMMGLALLTLSSNALAFMGVDIRVTGVISLIVLMAVYAYFYRIVIKPLRETLKIAHAITTGDLKIEVEKKGLDELRELIYALDIMKGTLYSIVDEVEHKAASVNRSADNIAAGNDSLSNSTEQQASSLEETASSMEQLTSTVKQNADNANQASRLAEEARKSAEKGGEVVAKAVHAMSEINQASKKIADIISVIDEIAFQTNLLALNAAVEAARAGEQGRGFAVVAGEVRNLAQRSASSAKEIKGLIGDSVARVEAGAELVNVSGRTLNEIVEEVRKMAAIVAEIASASREQSAGIEQINQAVMQLDGLTQKNATLVAEAAQSSRTMKQEASDLNLMMQFFNVERRSNPKNITSARSRERQSTSSLPSHNSMTSDVDDMPAPPLPRPPRHTSGSADWAQF